MNTRLLNSPIILICLVLQCLLGCTKSESEGNAYSTPGHAFVLSSSSNNQLFKVDFKTESNFALPINQFHDWILTVKDVEGNPVYPAQFSINGGMPGHGHGLPTQPQITKYLGEGQYLLKGMKFNMSGEWVLRAKVTADQKQDTVEIKFNVNH